MKKILVLALAIVMALSVVAFVACDQGVEYEGDCHYSRTYGENTTVYGCKVKVTVKGDRIAKVVLLTDEESGYVRTTKTWEEKKDDSGKVVQLGYTATEAAYPQWLKDTFEGKTVEAVKAYKADVPVESGNPTVETASANLAGATQSAARIIVAVQNALSKIPAAK